MAHFGISLRLGLYSAAMIPLQAQISFDPPLPSLLCNSASLFRLLCTQQSRDGRRTVLLSSPSVAALSDRVSALFGPRQTASLLPLRSVPPSEQTREEFGLAEGGGQPEVTVEVGGR